MIAMSNEAYKTAARCFDRRKFEITIRTLVQELAS